MNVRVVVHNDGEEHVLVESHSNQHQDDATVVIPPGHQHTLPHGYHDKVNVVPVAMSTERHHE